VILGGGYGGLLTAVRLEEETRRLSDVEIVLADRNDYHQYLHLAYEIVTGIKKVSDLTLPMTELLAKRKITFFQGEVETIDFANGTVKTDRGNLSYNELVIALGSEPDYYRIKGAEENSFRLSSVGAAVQISNELRRIMSEEKDPNIVIGGGGFTGVELAGEILDEFRCCITLVEASEVLLPSWSIPAFSARVTDILTEMGAKLIFNKQVTEVKQDAVVLNDGSQIASSLFVWTAGVQGSRVARDSGLRAGKGGRVMINEFCEAVDFPGVYVVGDCALVVDAKTGETLPQCVEIALQQAETVANNLYADVTGGERMIFVPKFSGLILAVGEKYGIGKIFGVTVEGRLAQMVKRMIHLRYVYEIAGLRKAFRKAL
jgi:NADH dehydrogenase